jgi:uncharacterized protein YndB with AHSA1/START domain
VPLVPLVPRGWRQVDRLSACADLSLGADSLAVCPESFTAGEAHLEDKPFMTVILTSNNDNGQTRYCATARHWSAEDRKTHEEMGFYDGWGQCADQLEALLAGT